MSKKIKKNTIDTKSFPPNLRVLDFGSFVENFYSTKKLEIASSAWSGYENIVQNHIKPYFGSGNTCCLTQDISSDKVSAYLQYKLNCGLSTSTVKKHRETIGQVLRFAYAKNWTEINIMDSVVEINPDRNQNIKDQILPADFLDRMLESAAGSEMYIPLLLAVRYGLDRSEILGLRWEDIDIENNMIKIRYAFVKESGALPGPKPIRESAARDISLSPNDINVFLSEKQLQENRRKECHNYNRKYSKYVMVTEKGNIIAPDNISRMLRIFLEKEKLDSVSFTDIRKLFIVRLSSAGFGKKAICTYLGINDFSISSVDTDNCENISNLIISNGLDLIRKRHERKTD